MSDLALYIDAFRTSPYALSAFAALEELGVPYELVEVSLADGEHRLPSYAALTGRIPALVHRGAAPGGADLWLAESQAIDEYLAELFPPPAHPRLYPEDRVERAIARQIQAWLRSDLMPLREERSTPTFWYGIPRAPLSEDGIAARDTLARAASTWLGDRTQLFEHWCIADVDLAIMLRRVLHDDLPAPLAHYVEMQLTRPAIVKWDAHERPPFRRY
ncbi:MAG: glutathione transferase [Sandaracinaceae bacterium]|nr:glutathione transferase [Sandaracinaceae bacterium]